MKRSLCIIPLCLLFSCVSLHTPSTHFVPSITQKNQFEGEISFGPRLAGLNLAYSPLKHVTVMGNVQALPLKVSTSRYQRNCELAIGLYGNKRRLIYGLNAGYGMGSYNWDYFLANDSTSYSLSATGNFQKLMVQPFLAFTNDASHPKWFAGISIKGNYFWDQYTSLKYSTEQAQHFSGLKMNTSLEPCLFTRNFFSENFYLNAQAGMNISYDESMFWPTQYLFLRLGIGLRL
jgi:hypothetical protein